MSAFARASEAATRRPRRTVTLQPNAFADTWPDRPTEARTVGLRALSEGALNAARSEGERKANMLHPDSGPDSEVWIEAFNAALMSEAVAAALCHPDNVLEPYWPMASSIVPLALRPSSIERLYDELELLEIGESVTSPEATDEEIVQLVARLQAGTWSQGLASGDERFLRRQLRAVLDRLAPVSAPPDET